jgi:Leucine-rich repeat (LRR) protein
MKRGRPPIALIGSGVLIAFALLLLGAGIESFVSPRYVAGGSVGWLLDITPEQGVVPHLKVTEGDICGYLSLVLGVLLFVFSASCGVAGLVIGLVGLSRPGTRSRSSACLLVAGLVIVILAFGFSAIWFVRDRTIHTDAAAVKAIQKLGGNVGVTGVRSQRIVHVDFKQVTDAGLKELKGLNGLTYLNLQNTQVTDAGLKELKELKSLHSLMLGGTRVTGSGLKELKEIKTLQVLQLDNTQVTDVALKDVKGLNSLTILYLQNIPVTDAGLKELKELESLRHLYLSGTQVTPAGIQKLKAARPKLEIQVR